jgi:anti-anti-sigma regulatory factor
MKKHGGNVKICCLKGVVVDLLSVTGLNRIFEVYPDIEKAVAAFDK